MRAALAQLDAEAQQLATAVGEASRLEDRAWQWLTGTESTAAAAAETARQAQKAADEMRPRLTALVSDPYATDDQGEQFIRDANDRAGVGASLAAVSQLTPTAGVSEVVRESAVQVETAAKDVAGKFGEWGVAIGGALIIGLVLGLYAYGKARAS